MFGKKVRSLVVVAPCSVCAFSAVVTQKGKRVVVEPCLCVYVAWKDGK